MSDKHDRPEDEGQESERPRRPGGAEWTRRRKAKEQAEREEHARRVAAGLEKGRNIPPCDDPLLAHQWLTERLIFEIHEVLSDVSLPRETRNKQAAELGRVVGMIQGKAAMESKYHEAKQARDAERDELFASRQRAEEQERRLQQLCEALGAGGSQQIKAALAQLAEAEKQMRAARQRYENEIEQLKRKDQTK